LEHVAPAAWVDERRVSTGRSRREMTAAEFVAAAGPVLGHEIAAFAGRGYARDVTRARILLVTVGVERWRQSPRELGKALGRRADVISRWVRWGAERRGSDLEFAETYDELDRQLSSLEDNR